ncbi:hypothetical protein ECZU01_36380 [Escherichia coli]|nr:hypothetical protein ECZU01_36380 [Escherichia coli]
MLPSETMIWQPEFTDKTLSRKPGAVQGNIHNGVSHAPEDVGHANKDNLSSTFKQMRTKEEK